MENITTQQIAAQIIEMLQEKSEEEKLQIIAIVIKKGIYEGLYIGDAFWGNLHINMDCDRKDISFVVTEEMVEGVKSIPIEKGMSADEWNECMSKGQVNQYAEQKKLLKKESKHSFEFWKGNNK